MMLSESLWRNQSNGESSSPNLDLTALYSSYESTQCIAMLFIARSRLSFILDSNGRLNGYYGRVVTIKCWTVVDSCICPFLVESFYFPFSFNCATCLCAYRISNSRDLHQMSTQTSHSPFSQLNAATAMSISPSCLGTHLQLVKIEGFWILARFKITGRAFSFTFFSKSFPFWTLLFPTLLSASRHIARTSEMPSLNFTYWTYLGSLHTISNTFFSCSSNPLSFYSQLVLISCICYVYPQSGPLFFMIPSLIALYIKLPSSQILSQLSCDLAMHSLSLNQSMYSKQGQYPLYFTAISRACAL